jgi:hypothetical protein
MVLAKQEKPLQTVPMIALATTMVHAKMKKMLPIAQTIAPRSFVLKGKRNHARIRIHTVPVLETKSVQTIPGELAMLRLLHQNYAMDWTTIATGKRIMIVCICPIGRLTLMTLQNSTIFNGQIIYKRFQNYEKSVLRTRAFTVFTGKVQAFLRTALHFFEAWVFDWV